MATDEYLDKLNDDVTEFESSRDHRGQPMEQHKETEYDEENQSTELE